MKINERARIAALLAYRATVIALLIVIAQKLPGIEYDAWQAKDAGERAEQMAAQAADSAEVAAEAAKRTASACLLSQ